MSCIAAAVLTALVLAAPPAGAEGARAVATFAGGCFWSMEKAFDAMPGVLSTTVGYTGGRKPNPTYEEVASGLTDHAEAVRVEYDPNKVRYEDLLITFWHNIDPTARNRQFCDVGEQYRSVIFAHDDEQRRLADESKRFLQARANLRKPIATRIENAGAFHPAEEYHQDFYRKNPRRYAFYRWNCGQDDVLRRIWGPPAGR